MIITTDELDAVLALQLAISWAGEGLSEPRRLDWWKTDLIDPEGGGDLFCRLLPRTGQWASLEAARIAAIRADTGARLSMAKPDAVRTLFFWGFEIDEALRNRLALHKPRGNDPMKVLPMPVDLKGAFVKDDFEEVLCLPGQKIPYKVVPGGRELKGPLPKSPALKAKHLGAALLPLGKDYPAPFYRIAEDAISDDG